MDACPSLVDAAIYGLFETLRHMDAMHDGSGITAADLRDGHPRLDESTALAHVPAPADDHGD